MKWIASFIFFLITVANCAAAGHPVKLNTKPAKQFYNSVNLNKSSVASISKSEWTVTKSDLIGFENDDDDFVASRKFVLLSNQLYCIGFQHKLLDIHACTNSEIIPTVNFSFLSSFKCILIRTLRI
ncbi:MAG TPA: hypothetical protein VF273_00825 [Pelobium sp.]